MSAMPDIENKAQIAASDDRFDQPQRKGRPGRLPPEGSGIITRRITALAVIVGLIMAAGKFWLYGQTGSVGIMASLVHSALDIVGAISSFIAVRYAVKKPDSKYRFGRGKAESFSAVFQVCLVVFAAFHLLEEVIGHVGHSHGVEQSGLAIFVMSLFIVITFWLLIAQSWAIRATGSIAVRGDRAHYMADLLANLFVIGGITISAFTPYVWADALVGGMMALWLLWTAFQIAKLAWAQLMDMELNEDERKTLVRLAMEDPKVRAVHDLRTRASGPHLHVQMRLDLDETLSLSDAHDIILGAEARMMAAFPAADILIHPHPAGCGHSHGNLRFTSVTNP
ncbi:cation diffusion facilitator family transporter [Litorimonas sp. RW-G-Af-16]|uniref:cation diffusion facilitator family transporter n=1 Tax=Litorimonas sp. RW-G-Af-16 TaxID=3241168 RepID=UPI00390C55A9